MAPLTATYYTGYSPEVSVSSSSTVKYRGWIDCQGGVDNATTFTQYLDFGVLATKAVNVNYALTVNATGYTARTGTTYTSYSDGIKYNSIDFSGADLYSVSYTKGHSAVTKTISLSVHSSNGASSWQTTTLTKSVTLTVPAKTSYTVTYNMNGGSGTIASQTKWYGETLTLSSTKPTRTGYVFKGWNTNASGTGTNYSSGGSYTANAGATLYAKWHRVPSLTATVTSSAPYYYPLDSYTVSISNVTTYDSATVSSIKLTVGSQSASRTNAGTLTITPNASGEFTPTVVITDNQSASQTYSLTKITINTYTAPSVSFDVERTLSTGVPDDEGTCAVINPTFTFTSGYPNNALTAPVVAVTDDNGTAQTVTTTWYSSRAVDGTLSGSVTWANLSSGATVYGLISVTGDLGLGSYLISVTPQDNERTGTAITQTLTNAFYTLDFLAGGHGIAFGQLSTQSGFFCNMDANFMQNVDIASGATYKVNGVDIVDFVITQNETTTTDGDGYWRWREWKSGKVEIWYHGTLTLATSTQTQGVYRTAKKFDFPNSYSLYKCTGIVNGADSGGWYNCGGLFNSSNVASEPYSKIEVMAYRISSALPTSASNVNIYICGEINN